MRKSLQNEGEHAAIRTTDAVLAAGGLDSAGTLVPILAWQDAKVAGNFERLDVWILPAAAPYLVQDINADALGSDPQDLTPVGSSVFFVANDGIGGGDTVNPRPGFGAGTAAVSYAETRSRPF